MLALARIHARIKFVGLVVFVIAALHVRTPPGLAACLTLALVFALVARLGARDALFVLRPLAPILFVTVVMQMLYLQQGDALVVLGPLKVTYAALAESARMVVSLFSIMLASVAFMRCTGTRELVRTLEWLLAPVRRLGVRTDGFVLALSLALRFVPSLVEEFRRLKCAQQARLAEFDGGARARVSSYMRLFAPLVRSAFERADDLAEALYARCF